MTKFVITWLPLVPLVGSMLLIRFSPTVSEGEPLFSLPIPLLARMKLFSLPFVLGLVLFVLQVAVAGADWLGLPLLVVVFALVLCMPVSYHLTTRGLSVGRSPFRRWTEFAGVRRSRRGALLVGSQRAPNYPIFLSGSRGDDEFVHILKQLILESYKGTATETERLRRKRAG